MSLITHIRKYKDSKDHSTNYAAIAFRLFSLCITQMNDTDL